MESAWDLIVSRPKKSVAATGSTRSRGKKSSPPLSATIHKKSRVLKAWGSGSWGRPINATKAPTRRARRGTQAADPYAKING